MPAPPQQATFSLAILLTNGQARGRDLLRFRVRGEGWLWDAATVEWRYRTKSWFHFGGTSAVNGRWPGAYRGHAEVDDDGRLKRLVLHGYAIESSKDTANAFEMRWMRPV